MTSATGRVGAGGMPARAQRDNGHGEELGPVERRRFITLGKHWPVT